MDLFSKLKPIENFAQGALSKIGSVLSPVSSAIQNVINIPQNVSNYFNPMKSGLQGFWGTPIAKGLADAQQFIESPAPYNPIPSFNIKQNETLPSKIGKTIANIPIGIGNVIVGQGIMSPISDVAQMVGRGVGGREPLQYIQAKSGPYRLGIRAASLANPDISQQYGIPQGAKQFFGDVAQTALPIASAYTGGKVFGLGPQAAESATAQGLIDTLKQGVSTGAKYGGVFGLLQGIQDARNIKNNAQYFGQIGSETAGSAIVGGAAGGAISGAGYTYGTIRNNLVNLLKGKLNVNDVEANQKVDQFLRDELGRFTGMKPVQKTEYIPVKEGGKIVDYIKKTRTYTPGKEPQWYGDLRQQIGMPKEGLKPEDIPMGLSVKPVGGSDTILQAEQAKKGYKLSDVGSTTTNTYLSDLIKNQESARQGEQLGIKTKLSDFYNKLKEQLVNAQAPIEDVLTSAEKTGKFQVLPKNDIRLQIDRSLRAEQLAGQFIKDNGLVDTIKKAPDLNALDQYMIAKQARSVAKNGIETGRNLVKDKQLIHDLSPIYESYAQQVNQYSRKLLQYSVDSGLISQDTANMLVKKYPQYVPLNRIFNEDELATQGFKGPGKGVASLSRQTVVQKLQGSERQIENPIASLVQKTRTAFEQGERNVAAQQLAMYKNLPGNPFDISPIKEGEAGGKTTFSALINGKKQIFQTTSEVAAAAKSLNKEQMGLLAKIVSIPTRLLRLGATGLNYPFALSNLIKDQSTAFINSKNAVATSTPIAFLKGLFSAVGHGDMYEELVRNAGGGTSFDIGREAPNLTVQQIRSSASIPGKIANVIKNPIRTVEDLIGRTEELTRAQQFHGMYDALIKQGRTVQDAQLLAGQAARENTVNFARGGTFSRVLNWIIPYFNAGVQGSRTLVRNLSTRPVQTLAKFAVGVGMPVAAATVWNLSDPQRNQAYQDIPDFEKQNSIIVVPPNPTKNQDGTWNVLKIPLSQEIASLTTLIRRPLEQAAQLAPVKMSEIANALFQAGTSLNTQTSTGLVSSLTPQIAKPGVEAITNKNLYTGQDIVPSSMRNLPPEQQIRKNTSGTARIIGKVTNLSPLVVQNEAQTMMGGLGLQLLNASDTLLNKAGAIPDNQVGGKSLGSALQKRFFIAQGSNTQNTMDEQLKQGLSPKETQAYDLLHTPRQVDEQGNPIQDNSILNSQQKAIIYLNYPKLQAIDAIKEQANPVHDPIWDLSPQWRNVVFASRVQLPNQKNTYDSFLSQQPWYSGFLHAQSQFYNSLPTTQSTQQQTNAMPYPQPSAYVQRQMDNKNWSDPQVKSYLDALTTYKNNQLMQLGLPSVQTSGGYTSTKKPPKLSAPKIKLKSIKLKTLKKLKLSDIKAGRLLGASKKKSRSLTSLV